ncbi:MAG: type II secretion system F family protein [Candidatus Bathyarchaeia archaeon]
MNVRDIFLARFHWMSQPLSGVFSNLEADLDAASWKIHPEVYLSIVVAIASAVFLIPVSILGVLFGYSYLMGYPVFPLNLLIYSPFNVKLLAILSLFLLPVLVVLASIVMPKLAASNRISKLKNEIPYASMYMSVMTSGGLTPYQSLLRMTQIDLLPTIQEEMERLRSLVISSGSDPISGMEQAVKVVNVREYKTLLWGYASTVRRGGDILHYLYNQTDQMFESLAIRIKSMGEHLSILMETNIIISILGVLGLIMIFVVSLSLPAAGMKITIPQFYLFSFAVLPTISLVFIYLGDMLQISKPQSNWGIYVYPLIFTPLALLFVTQVTFPVLFDYEPMFPQVLGVIRSFRAFTKFGEGTEASLGLALALICVSVPGAVSDWILSGKDKRIMEGISTFIRDIVEIRKTGLSPERCIIALSENDYGSFSRYLELISMKLKWGVPIHDIFDDFAERVNNWTSKIIIFFLIDTIEIGGGSKESLETLAEFVEKTRHLEQERKSLLLPLLLIPYIGAMLLTGTTVIFLKFFQNTTSIGGTGIPFVMLNKVLLTPLILHSFILGLTSGKMSSSNRLSAGFLHSTILVIISILSIWVAENLLSTTLGGGI